MGSNGSTAALRATCTTRPHGSRQDSSGGAFSLNEVSAREGGVAYMSRSDPIYNFHNFRFSITCFYEPSQGIPSCCRRGKVIYVIALRIIHIQYDVHLVALPTSISFFSQEHETNHTWKHLEIHHRFLSYRICCSAVTPA